MGRKIPGKKHRGVKDPYKQQEQRYNKIKNKLNAKPDNIDSQEIPRRLHSIAKFNTNNKGKTALLNENKRKRKKKKRLQDRSLIDGRKYVDRESDQPGMTRPTKLVPLLQQHPKETDNKFLKRVDQVTKEILKEADFEKKYKVEVRRNEQGRVVGVDHQEKTDPLMTDKQRRELEEAGLRKRAARRDRDKRRRGKKRNNADDDDDDEFSYYQDKFEFGEVVYEPPSLDTQKLTRKLNDTARKGQTFLFMDKLKKQQEGEGSGEAAAAVLPYSNSRSKGEKKKAPGEKNKKTKEKMSVGRQRILEAERQRVVEAYRTMKAGART